MGTSVYFNNQGATREQFLIEDMIIESIKNHGIDVYYLPRESQSELDRLFGDDPVKSFSTAYSLEMYLESFQDFEGNQEFFSKFGLQIQKEARVAVARRTFEKNVPTAVRNVPKEGDLIYLRVQKKLLEIKFVEEEKNFFQAGKQAPYMYGLNLEVFRYNGELIDTGIDEIDAVADARTSYGIEFTLADNGISSYIEREIVYQGATLETATAKAYVAGWDKPTRKLTLRNIKGSFATGVLIQGTVSGSLWTLESGNPQENAIDRFDENELVETEADNILDWTETNPFGSVDENY